MESSRTNKLDSDSKKNHPYKSYQEKNLKANFKKIEVYTVLDDTTEANLPIYSKKRIHKIHRISTKEELDKLRNPLISAYFLTRDNLQSSEQTDQPASQMPNSTDSLCSLP